MLRRSWLGAASELATHIGLGAAVGYGAFRSAPLLNRVAGSLWGSATDPWEGAVHPINIVYLEYDSNGLALSQLALGVIVAGLWPLLRPRAIAMRLASATLASLSWLATILWLTIPHPDTTGYTWHDVLVGTTSCTPLSVSVVLLLCGALAICRLARRGLSVVPRCNDCGYNLTGMTHLLNRCPECGLSPAMPEGDILATGVYRDLSRGTASVSGVVSCAVAGLLIASATTSATQTGIMQHVPGPVGPSAIGRLTVQDLLGTAVALYSVLLVLAAAKRQRSALFHLCATTMAFVTCSVTLLWHQCSNMGRGLHPATGSAIVFLAVAGLAFGAATTCLQLIVSPRALYGWCWLCGAAWSASWRPVLCPECGYRTTVHGQRVGR